MSQAEAVAPRQHEIDDGDVGLLGERRVQPRLAVERRVHGEPRLTQPARNEIGNRPVVLDDQSAHWVNLVRQKAGRQKVKRQKDAFCLLPYKCP